MSIFLSSNWLRLDDTTQRIAESRFSNPLSSATRTNNVPPRSIAKIDVESYVSLCVLHATHMVPAAIVGT